MLKSVFAYYSLECRKKSREHSEPKIFVYIHMIYNVHCFLEIQQIGKIGFYM